MGKHDQTTINLTMYLTLWVKFMLGLMKSIDCESSPNMLQEFLGKPQSVNKLMLTPFSPFDINCKELNLKNL